MPYNQDDPRSQLATMTAAPRPAGAIVPAAVLRARSSAPDEVSADGTATWFVRSQSCCVAYSEAAAGERLAGPASPTSTSSSSPRRTSSAVITAGGEHQATVQGRSVVIVPPGDSEIEVGTAGVVVRIFSNPTEDVLGAVPQRRRVYVEADPNVTPFEPWPDPSTATASASYALADVPDDRGASAGSSAAARSW